MSQRSKIALAALMVAIFFVAFNSSTPSAQAALRSLDPSCSQQKCCYNPCIKYLHRRSRCRTCFSCSPTQNIVMEVTDPGCCKCAVEVPMCIPACCQGSPCVSSSCGPFRGVVWYKWSCGFEARVTISRRGNITVTYFGS